jgi:hypothetical protein
MGSGLAQRRIFQVTVISLQNFKNENLKNLSGKKFKDLLPTNTKAPLIAQGGHV